MPLPFGNNQETGEDISLPYKQRTQGVAVLGQTGYGKTTLLTHMIATDVREGRTAIVLDPHGDLCKTIINTTPQKFEKNLVYLEVNPEFPFGLNLFACDDPTDPIKLDRTVDGVMQIIRKMMGSDQVFLRTDRVIRAIAYTLVENQGHTLAHVRPLLRNKAFRNGLVANVSNPEIRAFWEEYDESYGNLMIRRDFVEPVMNRVGMFLERSFLYRVMSQEQTTIDFAELLNSNKTYLVSIPIGILGAGITELLGTIFLFELSKAIYARAETEKRPRVHLYIDEYQRFTLSNITASLLKEGRKFGLGTTIALQVLSDLKDDENRNAVLQTGTLLCFQTIGSDSQDLARNFDSTPPPPIMETRQEPVLILSQHPVKDLLRQGHTDPKVNTFIQNTLYLFDEIEHHRREYYIYTPPNAVWKFFWEYDLDGFRNSHDEVVKALTELNDYFIRAMEQPEAMGEFTEKDAVFLFSLYLSLGGVLGIRPWYKKEENPKYAAYIRQQQQARFRGERGVREVDPRLLERAEEWVRLPLILLDMRDNPNMTPEKLEQLKVLEPGYVAGVVPQEEMIIWRFFKQHPHHENEPNLVYGLFFNMFHQIHTHVDLPRGVKAETFLRTLDERIKDQLHHLYNLINGVNYTVNALIEHPLMTPSGRYLDKERIMQQRTFADKQNEIASILATLPPYTLYCQLTTDTDIQQVQIKLAPPAPYPKPHADIEAVKAKGKTMFGRAWHGYPQIPTKPQVVKSVDEVVNKVVNPPPLKEWEEE